MNSVYPWRNTDGLQNDEDYRRIIDDIYNYCFKGWCDLDILFMHFLQYTYAAILHIKLKNIKHPQILLIEWRDAEKSFDTLTKIINVYAFLNSFNLDLDTALRVYQDYYATNIAGRFKNKL